MLLVRPFGDDAGRHRRLTHKGDAAIGGAQRGHGGANDGGDDAERIGTDDAHAGAVGELAERATDIAGGRRAALHVGDDQRRAGALAGEGLDGVQHRFRRGDDDREVGAFGQVLHRAVHFETGQRQAARIDAIEPALERVRDIARHLRADRTGAIRRAGNRDRAGGEDRVEIARAHGPI